MTTKRFSHKPAPPEPPCPNVAAHTEGLRGHDAAARMSRTHEQHQCPGCRLWVTWTPLPAGSLITCWLCGKRNVDPATLGEDDGIPDEPICPGCQAKREAQIEADRRAWAAWGAQRRWADAT